MILTESRPVVFGEVLFDHFPDGTRVLGGAPFNVAWHLSGFGVDPLFVTAVGGDEEGREVLDRMAEWGIGTAYVQVDADHPTGCVEVSVVDDEPRFEIPADQAWDHVDPAATRAAVIESAADLVYHGTLATRSLQSRQALEEVVRALRAATFADVNLREPWWSRDRVLASIQRTQWVKLNQTELAMLAAAAIRSREECRAVASRFARERSLDHLIVTSGVRGSLWVHNGEEAIETDAAEVTGFVDSVGAGDAFSAVLCLGILSDWRTETTLARASRFAAEICRVRGATVADRSLYDRFQSAWREESDKAAERN